MKRRAFLSGSGAVAAGVVAAGCGAPRRVERNDLLASGEAAIEGISAENPPNDQGEVEYYRAVASVVNRAGDRIEHMDAAMAFRDANGEILATATGDVVGVPAGTRWAFVGEYGGDSPGDVATVEVTSVRGFADVEVTDWREAGAVELSNVEAATEPDRNLVTVTGDVTNVSNRRLDVAQTFANLWAAEDRVAATATDRTDGLDPGETWGFSAPYRFSAHSAHLLPIVTEENDVTVPYVTGPTPFSLDRAGGH